MAIENLIALKEGYLGRYALDSENKGRSVFDVLVDEIVALEERVATLEGQMANRMLCKEYDPE